ncbi:hypothetical protein GOP47_0000435 [Adiantum capillus-veneris]|uniref:Uncharacterized protein n=1 Tax=Adiantum capillus-veneris TaxID=13818 RepID=A0A9D4ZSB9_ADICA|nr:hypothetical protein GOP47_0000435 [Adiantum capillus-veneris]
MSSCGSRQCLNSSMQKSSFQKVQSDLKYEQVLFEAIALEMSACCQIGRRQHNLWKEQAFPLLNLRAKGGNSKELFGKIS